jgi:hypothetical protein
MMASMMYNNMAFNQRFAPPHMVPMAALQQHQVGAQPLAHATGKLTKDKNAPKRNWTAYQFYVEEVFFNAPSSVVPYF